MAMLTDIVPLRSDTPQSVVRGVTESVDELRYTPIAEHRYAQTVADGRTDILSLLLVLAGQATTASSLA